MSEHCEGKNIGEKRPSGLASRDEKQCDSLLSVKRKASNVVAGGNKKKPVKPKGMPRRPLSAYNVFFREQRDLVLQESKTRAVSEKSSLFSGMAKVVADRWSRLSSSDAAKYRQAAKLDAERYQREMAEYQAKVVEKEKTRADPTRRTTTIPGSLDTSGPTEMAPGRLETPAKIREGWDHKAGGFCKPGQPSLQESPVPPSPALPSQLVTAAADGIPPDLTQFLLSLLTHPGGRPAAVGTGTTANVTIQASFLQGQMPGHALLQQRHTLQEHTVGQAFAQLLCLHFKRLLGIAEGGVPAPPLAGSLQSCSTGMPALQGHFLQQYLAAVFQTLLSSQQNDSALLSPTLQQPVAHAPSQIADPITDGASSPPMFSGQQNTAEKQHQPKAKQAP